MTCLYSFIARLIAVTYDLKPFGGIGLGFDYNHFELDLCDSCEDQNSDNAKTMRFKRKNKFIGLNLSSGALKDENNPCYND